MQLHLAGISGRCGLETGWGPQMLMCTPACHVDQDEACSIKQEKRYNEIRWKPILCAHFVIILSKTSRRIKLFKALNDPDDVQFGATRETPLKQKMFSWWSSLGRLWRLLTFASRRCWKVLAWPQSKPNAMVSSRRWPASVAISVGVSKKDKDKWFETESDSEAVEQLNTHYLTIYLVEEEKKSWAWIWHGSISIIYILLQVSCEAWGLKLVMATTRGEFVGERQTWPSHRGAVRLVPATDLKGNSRGIPIDSKTIMVYRTWLPQKSCL